jgi:hypothetical protein
VTPTSDDNDHFIDMPVIAGRWSHAAKIPGDRATKLQKSASDGLIRNVQAALCKQVFNVSIAQGEPGIEPDDMANEFRWETMAFEGDGLHPRILPQMAMTASTLM